MAQDMAAASGQDVPPSVIDGQQACGVAIAGPAPAMAMASKTSTTCKLRSKAASRFRVVQLP